MISLDILDSGGVSWAETKSPGGRLETAISTTSDDGERCVFNGFLPTIDEPGDYVAKLYVWDMRGELVGQDGELVTAFAARDFIAEKAGSMDD